VSAVTFPAYDDTEIAARNESMAACFAAEKRERERMIYERQIQKLNLLRRI
jgi:phage head maturation protease